MINRDDVEQFVEAPPTLLSTFSAMVAQRLLEVHPRLIGLSCIGQEQFVFALLVGKELKRLSNTPVLVGGTVYSRIVERGSFPANWFDRYLDVIVRNEGEKPLEAILRLPNIDKSQLQCVPGIVYKDNDCVRQTKVCDPLVPIELPVPDFDGMPLRNYISARITLPILSSRGCYWGHCEFCHHGMVYGEKYANYKSPDVIGALTELRTKYKVNYFAFNDEAIPPKTFRQLGQTLADSDDGMYFTGLMKFEKYFTADDFDNAFKAGFRSLYIGLESASERVLRLMRKNTEKAVMERNLRDGTNAGIWMHCFLFFGFPGEQPEDALETVDFILQHADIIGSFGAGTFSLEHNAPAAKQMDKHGLRVVGGEMGDLDVYYKYVVEVGIDQEQAVQFMNDLNATAYKEERYSATNWIPREHLLILLSNFSQEELVQECAKLLRSRNVGIFDQAREEISLVPSRSDIDQMIVINRLNRAVVKIRGASLKVVQYGCEDGIPLNVICGKLPWLGAELASTSNARLAMHESTKVI